MRGPAVWDSCDANQPGGSGKCVIFEELAQERTADVCLVCRVALARGVLIFRLNFWRDLECSLPLDITPHDQRPDKS